MRAVGRRPGRGSRAGSPADRAPDGPQAPADAGRTTRRHGPGGRRVPATTGRRPSRRAGTRARRRAVRPRRGAVAPARVRRRAGPAERSGRRSPQASALAGHARRSAGRGRDAPRSTRVSRATEVLNNGCLETGSQSVIVVSFAAPSALRAGAVALGGVAVAVVEGQEDQSVAEAGDPQPAPHRAARARDLDQIPLGDTVAHRLRRGQLHPHLGGRGVQLRGAARLGAGVEVVEGPVRGPLQGGGPVGGLVGRDVLGGLQDGLAS